jgi:D-alanyl-D-alanine carboxypeptidase (penicillin-binding protein 5/6)
VSKFVALMNQRVRTLGLRNSHFSNPVGLDQHGNYSSARDLVEMALLLRRNSFIRAITKLPRATLHSGDEPRTVVNRNDLVARYPFVDGVKTGHTLSAGYVLVGSAEERGVTVISSVLGDPTLAARDADSLALLRYGLSLYHRATAAHQGVVLRNVPVADQGDARAPLAASRDVSAVVRHGEHLRLRLAGAPAKIKGPLPLGSRVGTVEILRRGQVVGSAPLVTTRAIPRASLSQRVKAWAGRAGTLLLLAFLVACTVLLVLLRRRIMRHRTAPRQEPEAS